MTYIQEMLTKVLNTQNKNGELFTTLSEKRLNWYETKYEPNGITNDKVTFEHII